MAVTTQGLAGRTRKACLRPGSIGYCELYYCKLVLSVDGNPDIAAASRTAKRGAAPAHCFHTRDQNHLSSRRNFIQR